MKQVWIALFTASALCVGLAQAAIAETPDFTFTATFEGAPVVSAPPSKPIPVTSELSAESPQDQDSVPEPADISGYADEVLRLVNLERTAAGLSELSADSALSVFAQIRANELAQQFSHTRPDGTKCFTVFDGVETSLKPTGENIAFGQETPEAVVRGWMNSPGHKDNIYVKTPIF